MKSPLFRLLLVLGMYASAAFAQDEKQAASPPVSQSSDPVANSLVEMERQWAEVCATRDTSVLERILADDFLGTNTKGALYTKSEDIEKIAKKPKGDYLSGRLDRVKVRFFGDEVAVLHGVETCIRKTKDGKEEPETSTWTDTWLKRNGRWQIVTAQDAIYRTTVELSAAEAEFRTTRADTGFSQQTEPALQGFWTLNVEKSDFGGRPKPKMGLVNWGEHGWTFALVTADGRLFADGVSTDRGCALIGLSPNYSCEVDVVTPRHVRFTLKQGTTIRRTGEIELLEDGTTQTTHRVTPADGAPYVEMTIWEKQVRK